MVLAGRLSLGRSARAERGHQQPRERRDLRAPHHPRHGVTFHDGAPFTADDVVFSIRRAQGDGSNFKVFARPLGVPRKVDDYTVELATPQPAPAAVLLENVNAIFIMSRAWCEKHG